MPCVCNLALASSRVLGLCLGRLIAIKVFDVTYKGPAEEAKCEDLEKFAVNDDSENFFQIGA